jgi:hypothetical protein
VVCSSCSKHNELKKNNVKSKETDITEREALKIAVNELLKHGWIEVNYNKTIEMDRTGKKWLVSVNNKNPSYPGDDALITIEKDTGKTIFNQGEGNY